jgi:hypothetical protein
MSDPANKTSALTPTRPASKKYGPLYFVGLPLMIVGIVYATMSTMNHLKQQPPEPLVVDFTLKRGYGGFIAYGVAAGVSGFALMLVGARSKKPAGRLSAGDRGGH